MSFGKEKNEIYDKIKKNFKEDASFWYTVIISYWICGARIP